MADEIQSIKNLINSYAELLDTGDFDALGQLFERAIVRVHGSGHEAQGTEAVRQLLVGNVRLYNGIPSTKHTITNLTVELAANQQQATARSYYAALQACDGLPLQLIIAGRWHDRLEWDGERWFFAERVIYPDLMGDLRFHIQGLV